MRFVFALLVGLVAAPLAAQAPTNQKFEIAVDTAGIMDAGVPGVYMTWVFARESPKHHPVSGILVAFDCKERKVKRLAHIVYSLRPDGGIAGPVVEDEGEWQNVSIPSLFDLVCSIGPTHGPSVVQPTRPKVVDPSWRIS